MIYLENTTTAQTVYIPADAPKVTGTFTFTLKSTIDGSEQTFTGVADLSTLRLSYAVAVSLASGTLTGEYEYTLATGDTVLSAGLATLGDYEMETTTEYTQYEQ